MAVTSIWPIKGRVDRVINYARNPKKTTESGYEGDRVDDKMVVVVPGVAMGRHHDLKTVAPQLLCQLHADLMSGFRCYLAGAERLIAVVADAASHLTPKPLGVHELRCGGVFPAVQAGHIGAALRFHVIGGILHHTVNSVERRQFLMR